MGGGFNNPTKERVAVCLTRLPIARRGKHYDCSPANPYQFTAVRETEPGQGLSGEKSHAHSLPLGLPAVITRNTGLGFESASEPLNGVAKA